MNDSTNMGTPGPLDGVRVVDLTSVLMGPFASQLLGDMGADVIKVEAPPGDSTRGIGPMRNPGMGHDFLHVNRNKRGIVLDLKHPEGYAALLKMIERCDVLMYNVRPQAMARLGLTWEKLSALNPRLVMVGMVGYGQRGPYAAKPAYDDLIQGAVGVPSLLAIVGDGTPRYVPLAFVDRAVGLAAVNAVTAALFRREKSGRGQSIEVPMFETMVPFVLGEHMAGLTFEPPLGPPGYPRQLARERTPFPTRDGYVCALIYNDKHWRNFYAMIGDPGGFERDPRMVDIDTRTRHIGGLYAWVAEVLRTRTTAEWLALLEKADIPAMPLHTLESLPQDPHLNAVGFFPTIDHPTEGRVRQIAPAGTWSDTPPSIRRPAPRLGEHSTEVLAEHGYSAAEIERLLALGVTRQAPPVPREPS
ncbi:MAG TPA: CoA transferase [Burkholderiaceae bacterium]|nr:CoA transferase [Burkholderiaceae bacterium]